MNRDDRRKVYDLGHQTDMQWVLPSEEAAAAAAMLVAGWLVVADGSGAAELLTVHGDQMNISEERKKI